jgi:hypothetical protein
LGLFFGSQKAHHLEINAKRPGNCQLVVCRSLVEDRLEARQVRMQGRKCLALDLAMDLGHLETRLGSVDKVQTKDEAGVGL